MFFPQPDTVYRSFLVAAVTGGALLAVVVTFSLFWI